MSLALEIGMLPDELESRMTAADLYEWAAFFKIRRAHEDKAMKAAKAESEAKARTRRR